MAVITLSRQYGSAGDEVAGEVAQRLGYRVVDHSIMTEVAQRLGVEPGSISERDERDRGLVADLVATMRRLYPATVAPQPQSDVPDIDQASYLEMIRQVIWEVARDDNAVIIGRGANFILDQHPDVLNVLVVAPLESRIVRVMASEGLDRHHAAGRCHEVDAERTRYIRHFYRANWLDLAHYDLVLSTGHFSQRGAADLICQAIAPNES